MDYKALGESCGRKIIESHRAKLAYARSVAERFSQMRSQVESAKYVFYVEILPRIEAFCEGFRIATGRKPHIELVDVGDRRFISMSLGRAQFSLQLVTPLFIEELPRNIPDNAIMFVMSGGSILGYVVAGDPPEFCDTRGRPLVESELPKQLEAFAEKVLAHASELLDTGC